MAQRTIVIKTLIIFGLLSGLLLVGSCKEKDVPFAIDEDEIALYMEQRFDFKELFSTENFFDPVNYTVPFDSGVYRDSLISSNRDVQIIVDPVGETSLVLSFASYRAANIIVTDNFMVQTTRTYSNSIAVDTIQRFLNRYGIFGKLGNDDKDYLGWTLWGFRGMAGTGPMVGVEAEKFDFTIFRGGPGLYREPSNRIALDSIKDLMPYGYVKVSDIDTVVEGSRLALNASKGSLADGPFYIMLSGQDTSGYFTRQMLRVTDANIDTVRTARNTTKRYHLLFMQLFDESEFKYANSMVVPYQD